MSSSYQWEDGKSRIICPTPTPLPPITIETTAIVIDPLGTPVVITETRQTLPYEREYGIPITPTTYARADTVFAFGDIVAIDQALSAQMTVAAVQQGAGETIITIRMDVETATERHLIPSLQLGIAQWSDDTGQIIQGFWGVQPPTTDQDPDGDMIVIIPRGRSTWTWQVRIPRERVTPQAIEWRFTPTTDHDARVASMRVTWQAQRTSDPYCPVANWNGIWNAAYTDPSAPLAVPVTLPVMTSQTRATVLQAAIGQLNRPYCFGGKGWNSCPAQCFFGTCYPGCTSYPCWDCSGLVHYAWAAAGVDIGHGTWVQSRRIVPRPVHELEPGDLLFFWGSASRGQERTIVHVALFAGDLNGDGEGDLIHASWYDRPSHIVYSWQRTSLARSFAFGGSPIPIESSR